MPFLRLSRCSFIFSIWLTLYVILYFVKQENIDTMFTGNNTQMELYNIVIHHQWKFQLFSINSYHPKMALSANVRSIDLNCYLQCFISIILLVCKMTGFYISLKFNLKW